MSKEISRNEFLKSQGEPQETAEEKLSWRIKGLRQWERGVKLLNEVLASEREKIDSMYRLGEEYKLDLGPQS